MKNVLTIIIIAVLLLSTSSTSFADDGGNNIRIDLQENGGAEVSYGNENFDIDYMRYHDRVLIGRVQYHDLLELLHIASGMSGQKYELMLKHHAGIVSKCYDVIIMAYDNDGNICNTLEFDSTTKETGDGNVIVGHGYSESEPYYYLDTNGKYTYFLPLRCIFEQLGFSVKYSNETISISYNQDFNGR